MTTQYISYHLSLSGRIGDGHWTMSQQFSDDEDAIENAERVLRQSAIAAGADSATLWRGELGPTATCVASWDLRPTLSLERNAKREKSIARERTPTTRYLSKQAL